LKRLDSASGRLHEACWLLGLAVMTGCSWIRYVVTGSPKVDENYPALVPGTCLLVGLALGWALLVFGWYGLLTRPVPTSTARRLAFAGLALTTPMLPLLSNDVYSLLTYASLAARGRDVYATAALSQSPFFAWVGQTWNTKVCVYGPTTLVSAIPATLFGANPWAALALLRLVWLPPIAVVMELSFRRFGDRPSFHSMVWLNPLFMVEGLGQLHADVLGLAAVVAGIVLATSGKMKSAWALYAFAVLGKYTFLFAGPWFWLLHATGIRQRVSRLAAMAAILVAVGVLFYAPFWRGPATLTEPIRTLGAINPGGSIVEVVGDLVEVVRGGGVPSPGLAPEVAAQVERAAKGSTWFAVSLVLRIVFLGVAAVQLARMWRRSDDEGDMALATGALVVASITLASHRFQSWYLMTALPFFGLRCDEPWRRWWVLVIAFATSTEFIHELPPAAAILPVWGVVTNGAVVVVFLLWFRKRLLRG
jgi:hypothetical protein